MEFSFSVLRIFDVISRQALSPSEPTETPGKSSKVTATARPLTGLCGSSTAGVMDPRRKDANSIVARASGSFSAFICVSTSGAAQVASHPARAFAASRRTAASLERRHPTTHRAPSQLLISKRRLIACTFFSEDP